MGDFKLNTTRRSLSLNKTLHKVTKSDFAKRWPLFNGLGTVGGVFHNYGFAVVSKDSTFYVRKGYSQVVKNDRAYFRKIDSLSLETGTVSILYVIPVHQYDFLLAVRSYRHENDNMDIKKLLEFAQYEHEQHIEDMQIGKNVSFKDFQSPFDQGSDAFFNMKEGNYLDALDRIKKDEDVYRLDKLSMELYLQAMSTYSSFVADDSAAGKYWRTFSNTDSLDSFNKSVSFEPINDSVINEWTKYQVVMFNESHVNTRGRLGMAYLLKKFADRGFKYFAMEAINENDTAINERGAPDLESGFYTREYNMANLIRAAKHAGFQLVAYEQDEDQTGDRELIQAQNLFRKTIQQDSAAKVLVFAGWGHILKNKSKSGRKLMAQQFWNISGIEPFCIDQTYYSPHTRSTTKTPPKGLSVIHGVPDKEDYVDEYVYNNLSADRIAYIGGDTTDYKTVQISIPKIKERGKGEALLLCVYLKKEYDSIKLPVPCYIKKITNEKEIELKMAPGDYVWYIRSANVRDLYNADLKVTE
ncbi:MAG: hypothetical protein IT249_06305 [Chitinophagaceae bacterium]|nr:hypothetical protein [Chitinophagaceae bacterium]